jgi:hypothetical protein
MKRLSAIVFITIASVYILAGCTMMPASQETGVGPDEYAEIKNTEAINKENEDLKKELESKKTEINKMEKDYLELAKNNETMLSKLEEAETKLDILGNEGIPEFNSEKNDKNSIVAYLNNNKAELEKRLKGIEIVDSTDESKVLFYTTGYGEVLNQLFIWNQGDNEPILIDGADFEKGGILSWIDNKFLEIKSGSNEYKILNVDSKNIISKFSSKQDAYLIPETSSYIMQKKDNGTFVIYDFINSKEQDITLDNKGKFTAFEINGGNIIFKGVYTDENETQYSVEASMSIDKLKEKYNILTLKQVIEIKENNSNSTSHETTNEGTV